jgi:hypothetical protein
VLPAAAALVWGHKQFLFSFSFFLLKKFKITKIK